jgi:hypothetical protein
MGRGVYSSRSLNCFPHEHFYPRISFHNFSKSENGPDPPNNCFYCNFKQLYKKNLKILLPKQDCLGKESDVELSMAHNIGSSAEIPCIGPWPTHWLREPL